MKCNKCVFVKPSFQKAHAKGGGREERSKKTDADETIFKKPNGLASIHLPQKCPSEEVIR